MSDPIDLMQERMRRRPAEPPRPDDLFDAVELVRGYALRLHLASEQTHGVGDIACANLCFLGDCLAAHRQAGKDNLTHGSSP